MNPKQIELLKRWDEETQTETPRKKRGKLTEQQKQNISAGTKAGNERKKNDSKDLH